MRAGIPRYPRSPRQASEALKLSIVVRPMEVVWRLSGLFWWFLDIMTLFALGVSGGSGWLGPGGMGWAGIAVGALLMGWEWVEGSRSLVGVEYWTGKYERTMYDSDAELRSESHRCADNCM